MTTLTEFCKLYEEFLNKTKKLLELRKRETKDNSNIIAVEALKPNDSQQVMVAEVNMEIPLKESLQSNSVAFGAGYASIQIPYHAYTDPKQWIDELQKMAMIDEQPQLTVPDWLKNIE